jgi:hypothetical protein
LLISLLLMCAPVHAALHTFDSASQAAADGWTENLSRPAGGLGNDFGFSNTNNTTAPSGAGEAGGTIPDRATGIGYYADITGINYTQSDVFIASGWLRIPTFPADGGVELGFFNPASAPAPAGGYTEFAGFVIVDGNRVFLRQGGNANFETLIGADANNPIKFWMKYQPNVGGFQFLSAELRRASDNTLLASIASAQVPGNFNFNMTAFGLLSGDYNTTSGHLTSVFFDDLMIVPEPGALGALAVLALIVVRRRM